MPTKHIFLFFVLLTCRLALGVPLPGAPFKLAVSSDGGTVYASMISRPGHGVSGLAVLRRDSGGLRLERVVKTAAPLTGLVLSRDGKLLIATNGTGISIFNTADLTAKPLEVGTGAGAVYVNLTADGQTAFVSNERDRSISVVDIPSRRKIGDIAVGGAPIALTFDAQERLLFTTSQTAAPDWGWPAVCEAEAAGSTALHAEGAIVVIDVGEARKNSSQAVVAKVKAGCNPVRLALSPDGDRAYVTARKDHALQVFNTSGFRSKAPQTPVARIPVGTAPVPVVALGDGRTVVVGNSNRFGRSAEPSTLSVISTADWKVTATIPAGDFPRDLVLSPDGGTLYVASFGAATIDMLPLPLR